MSELPYKRRLRSAKRAIARKLGSTYQISTCDSGPFHLIADRSRRSRRIAIVFNAVTTADIERIENALAPDRSRKEIWRVSSNGRNYSVCHITKEHPGFVTNNDSYAEQPPRQFIYFMLNKSRGLLKIGKSLNTVRRFKELKHNQFDELELLREVEVENATKAEKTLHKKLNKYHAQGEWFRYCDAVKETMYDFQWQNRVKPKP